MLDSIVGICGNVIHLSGHPRRQRRRRSLRRGGGGGCWFDLTLHILRTSFNRRFQSTDPQDQHEVMSKRSSQYLIVGNQLGVVSRGSSCKQKQSTLSSVPCTLWDSYREIIGAACGILEPSVTKYCLPSRFSPCASVIVVGTKRVFLLLQLP